MTFNCANNIIFNHLINFNINCVNKFLKFDLNNFEIALNPTNQ